MREREQTPDFSALQKLSESTAVADDDGEAAAVKRATDNDKGKKKKSRS